MSKQYENDIAKEIHRETNSEIRAYRCGFSGSNAMPQPDVLVTSASQNFAMELKGPIKSDRCYVENDDLEQIAECVNSYTVGVLVIKFQRREPLVVRFFEQVPEIDDYDELTTAEKFARLVPPAFDPRVTDSGKLAVTKPDTDDWPSAQAGSDDVDAILSGVGAPTANAVQID